MKGTRQLERVVLGGAISLATALGPASWPQRVAQVSRPPEPVLAAPVAATAPRLPYPVVPRASVVEKTSALPHPLWSAPIPPPAAPPAVGSAPSPVGPDPILGPGRSVPGRSRSAAPPPLLPVPPVPTPALPAVPLPIITPVNRLISADGTLDVHVGIYSDCSGNSELSHLEAALDPCMSGVRYFVGHNPGVFSPLMHMGAGAVLTWRDGAGTAHRYRVVAVRQLSADAPRRPGPDVVAEFQTCVTYDGSVDRILDAVPA